MNTLLFYATTQARDAVLVAIEEAKLDGIGTENISMPSGVDPELPMGGSGILVHAMDSSKHHAALKVVRRAEAAGSRRLAITNLMKRCLVAGNFSAMQVETFRPVASPGLRMNPAVARSLPLQARAFPVPFRG